jgi:hypothetical protein
MDAGIALVFSGINALSVVVLVFVTSWYARTTARLFQSAKEQTMVLSLSAEVMAQEALTHTASGGANSEAIMRLRELV